MEIYFKQTILIMKIINYISKLYSNKIQNILYIIRLQQTNIVLSSELSELRSQKNDLF